MSSSPQRSSCACRADPHWGVAPLLRSAEGVTGVRLRVGRGGMFGLPIVGLDRYTRESGEMCWRLLNLRSNDVSECPTSRSAAGRHAAELLVAIPTVALDARVSWQPIDPSRALARFALGRDVHEITVTVGPSGALEELVMMRWGAAEGTLGFHVFGAALSDEGTFGGIAIPRQVTAGWHYGTDRWNEGAFIRWTVGPLH